MQLKTAVTAANETANATATAVDQAQNGKHWQMKRLMQLQQQSIEAQNALGHVCK